MPETTMPDKLWTYGEDSKEGGRPTQEDRCATLEFRTADGQSALLALVADGVGGRNTGALASQWAKEMIPALLSQKAPTASEVPVALVEAFEAAHDRIYNEVMDNPSRAGMGTTCTTVVIIGRRLYLAHVGDSRAYLIRGNQIHQLSIDHTWAEEAIQAGRSREEIRNHPNRGVIKRCLGINEDVDVDTRYRKFGTEEADDSADHPVVLEDGDRILLCTDGVSDMLEDARLLEVARRHPATENQAARAVVQAALKANAKDNVTAVVVDLPGAVVAARRLPLPVWAIGGAAALLLLAATVVGARLAGLWPPAAPTIAASTGTPTIIPTARILLATVTQPAAIAATPTVLPATRSAASAAPATPAPAAQPGGPTYTPIPTFTVEPTVAPAPTVLPVAPTTRQPSAPTVPSRTYASPALLDPPNRETLNGEVVFKWQPGEPLPDGAGYEVVWWRAKESPNTARGFADPVVTTELKTNLDGPFSGQQQTIRWAVLIVNRNPYTRLTQPSESNSRELVYQPKSNDGPTCVGVCD